MGMDEHEDRGLSRRDVIKRAAVVGAVAWSAPMISSIRTPAFAASLPPGCATAECGTFISCATPTSGACVDDVCACAEAAQGGGFCFCNAFCVDVTPCPNGQSDCSGNTTCALNTCCGNVCLSACPSVRAGGGAIHLPKGSGTAAG